MKTMTIPAGPEQLTAEWMTDALRSSGVISSATVTKIEPKVIGEGSGFIGQLAMVSLTYDKPEPGAPASLIAKFPAAGSVRYGPPQPRVGSQRGSPRARLL